MSKPTLELPPRTDSKQASVVSSYAAKVSELQETIANLTFDNDNLRKDIQQLKVQLGVATGETPAKGLDALARQGNRERALMSSYSAKISELEENNARLREEVILLRAPKE